MFLTRYVPRRSANVALDVRNLDHQLNSLFDWALRDGPFGCVDDSSDVSWSPVVDLREVENEVIVTADLPGLQRKEIDISVSGDTLTLRGERIHQEAKGEGDYAYRERHSGSFHRTIQLPDEVDTERTTATYQDGVLTVRLPKAARSKTTKIDIK